MYRGRRGPGEETGNFTFQGRFIVEAVVKDLMEKEDLGQLKQFVLMGWSAGAAGTATNCDDVADMIREEVNNEVDVRCVMEAGDLFPFWIHDEGCDPLENIKDSNQLWRGKLVGLIKKMPPPSPRYDRVNQCYQHV